ncbi:acetyl-CoA carboxylase, biotin carboxyl carrier protein [Lachnoclostridium sp. An131]|uniref:acetyl-CoA carboxylase biotin carboxyl carrier protein n=1 Tax=Lachnoclostridium sp. An131 TaxID=1965555 RepID=UPI000B3AE312|nr:acetyl-CoA carboxylase biotin carboxyl carrier protein [Lachnoclostridium sp. An131]OUQ28908.1 acetyl-CoA carboxylase, biotin carboxyl carrier protein [Lachnoclostridium sp. An131]
MNEAEIRKYASLMRELDLTGIEIDERNGVIRLEREKGSAESGSFLSGAGAVSESGMAFGAPAAAGSMAAPETVGPAVSAAAAGEHPGMGILDSVKSPTVGVFYAAPAENADPFVKVGDVVHKGSVLCIIEAMKLMNEVLAEKDGVIEEICARNGQLVEYGTELFRIKELSA